MTALQGLWDKRSGTLSLKAVEDTLFPTASSSRIVRTSTSQVTGRTYKYSVTVLRTLDPQEYMDIFHRLARYALDQTPPPPPVTWNSLGKLAREVGLLTKNVLRHVVFWFKGYDIEETALWTLSRSWSDLLATGPFATRPSRDGASLTHVDRSPDDAARLFVQALFDQIRAGFQNDWKDKPTKGMVRLLLFHCLRILTREGFSIPKQSLPERDFYFDSPSTDLLSKPVSPSRLAQGRRSRQELRRFPVPRGHGTL